MNRPRLLDAFCGAGGAAVGYHRAGFEVIGVDINPQPRYPFEFVQADALSILRSMRDYPTFSGEMWRPGYFAAIHASPPCQDHSSLSSLAGVHGTAWLLDATRGLLRELGLPYVIENVVGAPMDGMVLCGSALGLGAECDDGRRRQLRRHRVFETNVPMLSPGCACDARQKVGVYGHGGGRRMARGYTARLAEGAAAMGIDWMNHVELSQAIPPVYTELIGEQLIAALAVSA